MVKPPRNLGTYEERVAREVQRQLLWNNRVDSTDIRVAVNRQKVVTLTGSVPTAAVRRHAEELASMVPGVGSIDNRLAVRPAGEAEGPSDAEIQEQVRNIILWNPAIHGRHITATVHNGMVELTGAVGALWQRVRAEDFAAEVVGVTGVENKLVVVPTMKASDESIAKQIMAAIGRDLEIEPEAVTVTVQNGTVTFSGTVPDRVTQRNLENIAAFTPGVTGVKSDLRLQPQEVSPVPAR